MSFLIPVLRVIRQAAPRVVEGIIGPSAAYLTGHAVWGLGGALILAFVWTGSCLALRIARHRAASGLLILAVVSLLLRTAVSLLVRSPKAFFLGPDIVTAGLGVVFLVSAFTSKPLVARVAGDFVPTRMLDLSDPRAARLCRIASGLWGGEQLITAAVSCLLVFRLSPTQFVTLHEPISIGVFLIVMGAAVPFFWSQLRGVYDARPQLRDPAVLMLA